MRTLIIFSLFVAFVSCSKKNDTNANTPPNFVGVWVSERMDTLSFVDNSIVKYSNYYPYYTVLYVYTINGDSLSLRLAHSSNLNDTENYCVRFSDDKFEVFNFNDMLKSIYYRITD